ncbi:MAG: glycosyltransferase family 4 protein, partial [Proteobacteria bacterium]|nr:glycosyltransferase family 4 protein [Pseudomonadota bacterium]
ADARVPVVQTLHNYRLICPQALLLRNGRPCEKCVTGSAYHAVLYGCYRGSRLVSLVPARMVSINRRRGTWRSKVTRYIALTRFAKEKFIKGGLPADRIAVKPNFIADPAAKREAGAVRREGALFVGRLSPEKGIGTLLQAWRDLAVPLRILGDGPLADRVEQCDNPAVKSLGWKSSSDVVAEMHCAAFLVLPSEWYEGFGMVIVEAFATALPIVASRLGAMAEVIDDSVTGLHFEPGNPADLAAKVRWAVDNPSDMRRMGENARRVYEDRYTPEVNYRQLMAIYDQAAEAAH